MQKGFSAIIYRQYILQHSFFKELVRFCISREIYIFFIQYNNCFIKPIIKYIFLWPIRYIDKTKLKLCFFYFFFPKSFKINNYIYHLIYIFGRSYNFKYNCTTPNILLNLFIVACAIRAAKSRYNSRRLIISNEFSAILHIDT